MPAKVYELVDKGLLLGQQCLIRYHFVNPDGVGDPGVMASDYIAHVIPALVEWESIARSHTSVIYREVYPNKLLGVEVPVVSGGEGGTPGAALPGSVTWSVKWVIGETVYLGTDDGRHIKRGGKHLGGLAESYVAGNVFVTPSSWATEATNLMAALEVVGGDDFLICVAGTPRVTPPAVADIDRYALVTNAVSQGVGSQVSRKPSHGR